MFFSRKLYKCHSNFRTICMNCLWLDWTIVSYLLTVGGYFLLFWLLSINKGRQTGKQNRYDNIDIDILDRYIYMWKWSIQLLVCVWFTCIFALWRVIMYFSIWTEFIVPFITYNNWVFHSILWTGSRQMSVSTSTLTLLCVPDELLMFNKTKHSMNTH